MLKVEVLLPTVKLSMNLGHQGHPRLGQEDDVRELLDGLLHFMLSCKPLRPLGLKH